MGKDPDAFFADKTVNSTLALCFALILFCIFALLVLLETQGFSLLEKYGFGF